MSDLVPVESDPLAGIDSRWRMAQRVADTEFVPQAFRRRPDAVLAAIQFGAELGIGPMQSLQSIDVIQGKPTLSAEAMRARVFAAGHTITTEAYTDEECVLVGTRKDGTTDTVKFSMDDARRAGLTGKDSWKKYPRSMLLARATSELCRLLFPDVLSSVSYTMEELDGEENPPKIAEPIANDDVLDVRAIESYCHRPECGHMASIHQRNGCSGIRVVGVPNTEGADRPCTCIGFVADPTIEEIVDHAEVLALTELSGGDTDPEPPTPPVEAPGPPLAAVPRPEDLGPKTAPRLVSASKLQALQVRVKDLTNRHVSVADARTDHNLPALKIGIQPDEFAAWEGLIADLERDNPA